MFLCFCNILNFNDKNKNAVSSKKVTFFLKKLVF